MVYSLFTLRRPRNGHSAADRGHAAERPGWTEDQLHSSDRSLYTLADRQPVSLTNLIHHQVVPVTYYAAATRRRSAGPRSQSVQFAESWPRRPQGIAVAEITKTNRLKNPSESPVVRLRVSTRSNGEGGGGCATEQPVLSH